MAQMFKEPATSNAAVRSSGRYSEQRLLVRASRLYYLEEKGQAEIARLLDVSRPSVSRLLSRARREGIVEIRIRGADGAADWARLARSLGLRQLIVAEAGGSQGEGGGRADAAKAAVGQAAAEWFEANVRPGEAIGLTAGTTLAAFTRRVRHGLGLGLEVVPLVGSLWETGEDFDGSFLCQELRRCTGGTHLVLSAPAVVGSTALARSLRAEPRVRGVLGAYGALRRVIVGIGNADEDHPIVAAARRFPRKGASKRQILPRHVVASVGGLFYDVQGRPCRTVLDGRTIGITHSELLAVPHRIGLAAGAEKLSATLALVRGGVINVLIADEPLARGLQRQIKET